MCLYLDVSVQIHGLLKFGLVQNLMLFFSNDIAVQETFGNHKTTGSLFCCLQTDDLGSCFLNEARPLAIRYPLGSSAFFAAEYMHVSRLHNHKNLRKSFVLSSANHMVEPSGASRVTS